MCRCQIIPLLSKAWRQAHLDYPPPWKEWIVGGTAISHSSFVRWFLLAIAPGVESLKIDRRKAHEPDFLPQLLALAGSAAPCLQTLSLRNIRPKDGGALFGGQKSKALLF